MGAYIVPHQRVEVGRSMRTDIAGTVDVGGLALRLDQATFHGLEKSVRELPVGRFDQVAST